MRGARITFAAALLASLVATGSARADSARDWSRPLAITIDLSTPPSILGPYLLSLEVTPAPWISVSLGGGYSFARPVVAGMVRLQYVVGPAAFGVEGGLDSGPLRLQPGTEIGFFEESGTDEDLGYTFVLDNAIFGKVGPSITFRAVHAEMRIHGGAMSLLNRGDVACIVERGDVAPRRCALDIPRFEPYVALSFGYAFDPFR